MAFVELILATLAKSRVPIGVLLNILLGTAGVLLGIAAVTYIPHGMSAAQTHIGPPTFATFAANAVWPAIAALVLILLHRYLPRRLQLTGQYLALGPRQHALWIVALGVVGGSTLWAWACPQVWIAQALPFILVVPAVILLAAVMLQQEGDAPSLRREVDSARARNDSTFVPAWARGLANSIVAGAAVSMALLVWALMSRLPMGVGGLREKCVQIEVSTVGMPLLARTALVGAAATKRKSPGSEMTLPTRILRKDEREAFLWMSTGQGVTVPLERIGITLDYHEGTAGCAGDGA
jgi:hypothetical protein